MDFLNENIVVGNLHIPRYVFLAFLVFFMGIISFSLSGYSPAFMRIGAAGIEPGELVIEVLCLGGNSPQAYISWSESKGATSYEVQRKFKADNNWTGLKKVSADDSNYTDLTIDKNQEYFYRVVAINRIAKRASEKVYISTNPYFCNQGISPLPIAPPNTAVPSLSPTPTPAPSDISSITTTASGSIALESTPAPTPIVTPVPKPTVSVDAPPKNPGSLFSLFKYLGASILKLF